MAVRQVHRKGRAVKEFLRDRLVCSNPVRGATDYSSAGCAPLSHNSPFLHDLLVHSLSDVFDAFSVLSNVCDWLLKSHLSVDAHFSRPSLLAKILLCEFLIYLRILCVIFEVKLKILTGKHPIFLISTNNDFCTIYQ